jgi:hypothetical protein
MMEGSLLEKLDRAICNRYNRSQCTIRIITLHSFIEKSPVSYQDEDICSLASTRDITTSWMAGYALLHVDVKGGHLAGYKSPNSLGMSRKPLVTTRHAVVACF